MNIGFYTIPNRPQTHVGIGQKPAKKVPNNRHRPFNRKREKKSRFSPFCTARYQKKSCQIPSRFKNKMYTLHSAGVRSFRFIVCYRHCDPLDRKRDAKWSPLKRLIYFLRPAYQTNPIRIVFPFHISTLLIPKPQRGNRCIENQDPTPPKPQRGER